MAVTQDKNIRKKRRVRAGISGTAQKPRIAVHRSNKYIYAQAIDDSAHVTLAASSSSAVSTKAKQTKSQVAFEVGRDLAKKLADKKVTAGVFDRSRFSYKGRVQKLAEGMREAGFTI